VFIERGKCNGMAQAVPRNVGQTVAGDGECDSLLNLTITPRQDEWGGLRRRGFLGSECCCFRRRILLRSRCVIGVVRIRLWGYNRRGLLLRVRSVASIGIIKRQHVSIIKGSEKVGVAKRTTPSGLRMRKTA